MSTSDQSAPRGGRLPRSQRRAQLLDAAQAVFVARGYHAAAMDEIADRAGVSKPVLYQHFPGKLDLYLALLDQHCQTLERLVVDAISATHDNKARVRATIAAYFAFVAREDGAFRMVFESDLTGVSAVRQRLDEVEAVCAEAIADVIAEETGADAERSLMLGTALSGLAQVTARHWLAQGGPFPQSEAAELVSTLAWRGIGAFPTIETEDGHGAAEGSRAAGG